MKARIKFSKHGILKYIGHLDIMRYFQRIMRMANIPIKYSEGFSPHQIMSFASPLGIGLESDAEYLDIELVDGCKFDAAAFAKAMNDVCCDGISILEMVKLADNAKNSMSLVSAADYELVWDKHPLNEGELSEKIKRIMSAPSVVIDKLVKKSGEMKKVDIRPLIYELELREDCIHMCISQGSENNLRPEYVAKLLGVTDYHILRTELYGDNHRSLIIIGRE